MIFLVWLNIFFIFTASENNNNTFFKYNLAAL